MFVEDRDKALGACRVGAFFGAVEGLTNSEYHSFHDYWSSTDLKFMYDNSPAHFQYNYFPTRRPHKQTESQILGSLVHCLLLSPQDFDKEFATMPDFPAKVAKTDPTIKEQKEAWHLANVGKTPYDGDLLAKANEMAKSVRANKKAMDLINRGKCEIAFFWKCKYSGLKFKAKLDVGGPLVFVELKTALSANSLVFGKQVYNLHYDLSLIHYGEALRSKFNVAPKPNFIVVEPDAPFVCRVYDEDHVSPDFLETGHVKWMAAVDKLAAGVLKKEWPGYDETESLCPPAWAFKKVSDPTEEKNTEGGDW